MPNVSNSCGNCNRNNCVITDLQVKTAYVSIDPTVSPPTTHVEGNLEVTGTINSTGSLGSRVYGNFTIYYLSVGNPVAFYFDLLNYGLYGYDPSGNSLLKVDSGTRLAIGGLAGNTSQGNHTVAIGNQAGTTNQGNNATAIGSQSGRTNQGIHSVAVGHESGLNTQSPYSVAVGSASGHTNQNTQAVAVGFASGYTDQASFTTAVGAYAGHDTQAQGSVAIGCQSGAINQAANAVGVGFFAGSDTQGTKAVALGPYAGTYSQGQSSVAVGYGAGYLNQHANSIVLNASGSNLNTSFTNSFYVSNIRSEVVGPSAILRYNGTTREITCGFDYSPIPIYNIVDVVNPIPLGTSGFAIFPSTRDTLTLEANTIYSFYFSINT